MAPRCGQCAFARGDSIEQIFEWTKINPWFLSKLKYIHDIRVHLKTQTSLEAIPAEMLKMVKMQARVGVVVIQW